MQRTWAEDEDSEPTVCQSSSGVDRHASSTFSYLRLVILCRVHIHCPGP